MESTDHSDSSCINCWVTDHHIQPRYEPESIQQSHHINNFWYDHSGHHNGRDLNIAASLRMFNSLLFSKRIGRSMFKDQYSSVT